MKNAVAALALASASLFSQAQVATPSGTPVGLWKTIDDETHTAKSYVRIVDAGGGQLQGKVEKILDPAKVDAKCVECTDADQKDKPILGMTLFTGAKQDSQEPTEWGDTRILKPEDGRRYTLKMKVLDGGKTLRVRGYLGIFYRTQEWIRVE